VLNIRYCEGAGVLQSMQLGIYNLVLLLFKVIIQQVAASRGQA